MTDSQIAIDLYRAAAALNREDPLLDGSLLRFPDFGQLVMTGDLHGHRRNLERLRTFCDFDHAPARHVILHEVIHAELEGLDTPDLSHLALLDAAEWKCEYPEQVHFLQSNHELSQITGHEISKGGRIVTEDFVRGVEMTYGDAAQDVYDAILEFLRSFALAGRSANRVFLAHSLPGVRDLPHFDPTALTRPLASQDLSDNGIAYGLVWGRYHTPALLAELAESLDVDLFICGHQPQESGYSVFHDRLIIIASDHNHGVFLPFDLRKRLTLEDLVRLIRMLASVA